MKELEYEGSITIDQEIMELADIANGEIVAVFNVNNGLRFETYVIPGNKGSGVIGLNGAAARLGEIGDRLIILAFAYMDEEEIKNSAMHNIRLDENNHPT
jgi:aspartate 1-decarboxylase